MRLSPKGTGVHSPGGAWGNDLCASLGGRGKRRQRKRELWDEMAAGCNSYTTVGPGLTRAG
jgi:hypothetical protein